MARATGLARAVAALAQALEGPVDPVEHRGGSGEFGLVAFLHGAESSPGVGMKRRFRALSVSKSVYQRLFLGRNQCNRYAEPDHSLDRAHCRSQRCRRSGSRDAARLSDRSPVGRHRSVRPGVSCARSCPRTATRSAESLALMLSELATNAVQHAATEFEVAVELIDGGRSVRVSVTDTAEGFPTPEAAAPDAPRGRGLHIVSSLADDWGVDVQKDPAGQDGVVLGRAARAAGGAVGFPVTVPMHWEARALLDKHRGGRPRPASSIPPPRRAARTGPRSASAPCSTSCATPWWPPTSWARSATSTRRPRS